mgnify:CR=1 FL=1
MKHLMGIGDFGSSKGKLVVDNVKGPSRGAVAPKKKRAYRQYMNRRGGMPKVGE